MTSDLQTFIGRRRELAELERGLERLASGERSVVEVVGEPGIGKSRLAAELVQRAEARGYVVLEGRAAEFERDIPFGLVIDALNDFLGAREDAWLSALGEPAVAELAAIFPALSSHGRPPVRPQSERYRAHYAIRAALERVAAQQPVVLALDDVHWADEASIEVIGHLVRRFRGPLLAAFVFRGAPDGLVPAFEAAERGGFGRRLPLEPLTREEADALLGPQLEQTLRTALYRESGGNPFYLEELARASARPAGARALRAAAVEPDVARLSPPPSVAASVRAEFSDLPACARTVLDAAAVAGEAFELDLVATIAEFDEPRALEALDELLEAGLLRPTDAPRRFHFRHPIVRRSVYEAMPSGWRLGAHARAAAALAEAFGPIAARAHHVERSAAVGDEPAIALLTEAARATSCRAPRAAGRWLTTALRLLPPTAHPDRRLALLTEAATLINQSGASEEGLVLLEEALALVTPERPAERARLVAEIAAAKRMTGYPLASRTLLEAALDSLAGPDDPQGRRLRVELTLGDYFAGDFARMRERAAALRWTARAHADAPLATLAATFVSIADSSTRHTAPARTALAEAEAAFEPLRDGELAVYPELCGLLALAALRLERVDAALRYTRRGLAVARDTGRGSLVPGLLGLEAQALLAQGRVEEAVQVAETATDAAILAGNDQLLLWTLQTSATAAVWAGDVEQATLVAREAVALAQRMGEGYFSALASLVLGGALLAAGDAAGARHQLDELDEEPFAGLLDLSGGRGWEVLVRTQLELGDTDAAETTAARALARAAATGLDQQTANALCARAAVELARGDHAAVATAGEAAARAESAGNPLLGGRARALCGRAAAAAGERDLALAELEAARAAFVRCGARRETDAAARELRRLGRRVHRVVQASPDEGLQLLSVREREVAEHVAAGETNRGIAGALFLSEKTIESHLARIYGKLGVRSRVALAALVERERLTDKP